MAMQPLADVEEVWVRKGKWNFSGPEKTEEAPDLQLHVDRQLRVMSHSKSHLEQMLRDLIQEAQNVGFGTEAGKLVVDKYL